MQEEEQTVRHGIGTGRKGSMERQEGERERERRRDRTVIRARDPSHLYIHMRVTCARHNARGRAGIRLSSIRACQPLTEYGSGAEAVIFVVSLDVVLPCGAAADRPVAPAPAGTAQSLPQRVENILSSLTG